MIIAVDGPAAAGKGTLAKRLAAHFALPHLDTGLIYRAVGRKCHESGMDPEAAAAQLTPEDLNSPFLRDEAVGRAASEVAAIPAVRLALLDFQRRFARQRNGAVLDGRDIGTVVCPEAEIKLFVTASMAKRAERRWKELLARGEPAIAERVLMDMQERDARDASRDMAPLAPAADAVLIDTSELDEDAVFQHALDVISRTMTTNR